MSAPFHDSRIDAREAPPPYDAVSGPGAPADLAPEKAPLPDYLANEAESALDSEPPPPFTVTPGTFVLGPNDKLIRGNISGVGRPLYQLSKQLNSHPMSVTLIDVPEDRLLYDDDTLWREDDQLYKIYAHRDLANMNARVAEVSAQKPRQFYGVRLHLETTSSMSLTGVKAFFEATCGDDLNKKILYQARQKKGVLEWRDSTDRLVAIDHPADRKSQEENLEILVSLDKKHLNLMVALWVARIWHDTQAEGKKEDKQVAKQRKSEQKQLAKEEGRPHGPLHNVKEALGIGYGVKGASNGIFPGGMPGTSQSGRINWGGSRS